MKEKYDWVQRGKQVTKKRIWCGQRVERRILAGVPFLLYRPRHDPTSWPPRKSKKLFQPCPKIINNNHHAQSAIRIITQNNTPSIFFFTFFFFFSTKHSPLSLFSAGLSISTGLCRISAGVRKGREKEREHVNLGKTLAIFFFFSSTYVSPRKSRIILLFINYCF